MKLENIDKSIQKQDILQGISLEVSPQKLTAFIGPNGAGKSTLLSIMSRLTKKDQGVLSIKGREIESWNSQELEFARTGPRTNHPKTENQLPSQIDC